MRRMTRLDSEEDDSDGEQSTIPIAPWMNLRKADRIGSPSCHRAWAYDTNLTIPFVASLGHVFPEYTPP